MKNNIVRLLAALEVRPWLAPLSIGVLALLPRAALALYLPPKIIWYDGGRYMRVADNLLQTGGFGSLRDNMLSVPAQPVLLAALRLLFGTNFTALRLCFAVLGAVTCVVCYLLARRLFGTATALLAAVALALYPPYIYVSALFEYPQTLYILVIGCSFLLLLRRYFEHGGLGAIAVCGLLLGVAIETVPTTQLFIPLVVLCALFVKRWSALPGVILLCLCVALPVGAWTVRNYLAYGDPILVNRAGGWSFWTANNETYFRYGKQAVVPPCENGNQDYEFCHEWTQIRRDLHEREELTTEQRVRLEDQANWEKGKQFLLASPVGPQPWRYASSCSSGLRSRTRSAIATNRAAAPPPGSPSFPICLCSFWAVWGCCAAGGTGASCYPSMRTSRCLRRCFRCSCPRHATACPSISFLSYSRPMP